MSAFEYIFSFYGLLLGLALAKVATGFAEMWHSRDEVAFGTLVPLMCVAVVSFVASQWMGYWVGREVFTISPATLSLSLGVAVPYIFVSEVMFPKRPERWASLDTYFLKHAGIILGPLLIVPVIGIGANIAFGLQTAMPETSFWIETTLRIVITLGLPVVMIWKRRLWLHRFGLAAIIGFNLFRLINTG